MVCRSFCWSVCLSVTTVNPAKTAELIKMLFGMWTRLGPRNHVRMAPSEGALMRGWCWDFPACCQAPFSVTLTSGFPRCWPAFRFAGWVVHVKKWSELYNEDDVGGQEWLIRDEDWVLQVGWTQMRLRRSTFSSVRGSAVTVKKITSCMPCNESVMCCSVVCRHGTGRCSTRLQCGAAASSTFSSATCWCPTCGRSTRSTVLLWACSDRRRCFGWRSSSPCRWLSSRSLPSTLFSPPSGRPSQTTSSVLSGILDTAHNHVPGTLFLLLARPLVNTEQCASVGPATWSIIFQSWFNLDCLHFAWGVADVKSILVTAVCVFVCVTVCVCLSVCLSVPHYCTNPHVSWGNGRRCPVVVTIGQICIRCTGFIGVTTAPNAKCQQVLVLALCLVCSCVVCFCCVGFSFFSTMPRDWLGRTSLKWPVLCRVGSKTLTQSIQSCAFSCLSKCKFSE